LLFLSSVDFIAALALFAVDQMARHSMALEFVCFGFVQSSPSRHGMVKASE
jgi:hypothetical protein